MFHEFCKVVPSGAYGEGKDFGFLLRDELLFESTVKKRLCR